MTQDEIRKLLGGYATDALTPAERRVLFQAALEDQDLFNALANEDALKQLLDDPVTRAQVRSAIEPRPRRQFHPRRWLLGVAIPAVVAVALVVMMNRAGAPRLVATNESPAPPPVKTAPTQAPAPSAATSSAPVPAPKPRQPKRGARIAPPTRLKPEPTQAPTQAVAQASPPAPETVAGLARPRAVVPAMAALRTAGPATVPPAVLRQFDQGSGRDAPLYQGPLVQYALLRSAPNGREIRVQVTTGVAGYLALYEVGAAGNATRVYPAGEAAARVAPNVPLQIPTEPIEIREAAQKLRLVVVPVPVAAGNGFLPRTQGAIGAAGAADVQATPLVVEIPLAP